MDGFFGSLAGSASVKETPTPPQIHTQLKSSTETDTVKPKLVSDLFFGDCCVFFIVILQDFKLLLCLNV